MDSLFLLAQLDLRNPTTNPLVQWANLGTLINILTPLATIGAALLFGGMLLLMAYKILTAGGDAEQVAEGQRIGTYAVLGLAVVIFGYLLVKVIGFVLGINIPI